MLKSKVYVFLLLIFLFFIGFAMNNTHLIVYAQYDDLPTEGGGEETVVGVVDSTPAPIVEATAAPIVEAISNLVEAVPSIELIGDAELFVQLYSTFVDPGCNAYDAIDGDITVRVVSAGYIDTDKIGTYERTYYILNSSGVSNKTIRTVHVLADEDDIFYQEGDGWEGDVIDYESMYGFDSDHILLSYPTGHEKVFVVYDLHTHHQGIYDIDAGKYLIDPGIFDEIVFDNQGIACIKMDGYYGFIDRAGNKLTGFIFDNAKPFHNGSAIIGLGRKYGVIDQTGNLIMKNIYDRIEYSDNGNFLIVQKEHKQGVFSCAGKELLPIEYYGFQFEYGKIYASLHDYAGNMYADFCHMYDEAGNSLVGGDLPFPKDTVIVPPVNGRSILCYLYHDITNRYGYAYGNANSEACFSYADLDGKPISNAIYEHVSDFSDIGLALAYYRLDQYGHKMWVVVAMDGTELCEISPNDEETQYGGYLEATHSFAVGYNKMYKSENERYTLVNLVTKEVTRWADIQRITGTDCLFVRDSETEMYGLYDGDELVFPCMYHDYSLRNGIIVMEQGSERYEYTPKQFSR